MIYCHFICHTSASIMSFFLSSSIYYFLFYYRLLLLWYNNHLKNFILTVTTIFKDFYKLETKKVMFYSVTSINVNENKKTLKPQMKTIEKCFLYTKNIYKYSPLVSLISKNDVNGFPSDTNPYRISRGIPLSPSSAWTWSI
jgi:hypothetical protein